MYVVFFYSIFGRTTIFYSQFYVFGHYTCHKFQITVQRNRGWGEDGYFHIYCFDKTL